MISIKSFTQGKKSDRNEDSLGYNETMFVVADGATDKSGRIYDGKTGGEILSDLIVKHCLESDSIGVQLIEEITQRVSDLYKKINSEALENGFYRANSTLVCARIVGEQIHIVQVGDTSFRINGKKLYENNKLIDELTSSMRSLYIERTGDVENSREVILPILKEQWKLINNTESKLGYGSIDGAPVPKEYIKIYKFDLKDTDTLEIFTDGYFDTAKEVSLESWERAYDKVEREDPDKWMKYKSTKTKDDRSILIVKF